MVGSGPGWRSGGVLPWRRTRIPARQNQRRIPGRSLASIARYMLKVEQVGRRDIEARPSEGARRIRNGVWLWATAPDGRTRANAVWSGDRVSSTEYVPRWPSDSP